MSAIIDLRHLQHFVYAAEELNFARAAERAHITQTPFSRSIQALEETLGLRLFDRTTRSVALTPVGKQALVHARALLAQARCFDEEVLALVGSEGGEVSFGASQFAVDTVLPGVLPALRATNPNIRLDVSISHWSALVDQLEDDKIEFFIAFPGSLPTHSHYRVTPLPSQPASLFCRAGHPLLGSGKAPARDALFRYPWGALEISDTTISTILQSLGENQPKGLPMAFNCASKELLLEALLTGDMLAVTWSVWLAPYLAAGSVVDLGALVRPKIPAQLLIAKCALVERADRTLSPLARRVKERVVARGSP